ncbi:hypothetical protein SK128_005189 [Halocaridina rubra]|uniref:Sarcosine dehydrogenase n=1 Tax=Halocaridina rubra TaxID=373956 RepID=A0AAN8X656_HALRR
MLWELRHTDTDIQLIQTTRDLVLRLEKETGINPGWINNGGIMTAESKNRLEEYKHIMTLGKTFGIETHILDPAETKNLYPLMNVNDLVGSLYSPRDGSIDPTGYCAAMVRSAKEAGTRVLEECPVTDIKTTETLFGGRKVTEVHTPYGIIKTNVVVNATGGWGNDIARMVGLELPLIMLEHSYVITEKIPGIENMPNIRDTCSSGYLKLQGDCLSVGGFESNPVFLEELEKDSPFKLYELKWDAFGELLEGCSKRVPSLETVGIKSTVSGPESFTVDHKPIMGEDPAVQGFFHCCGFNSSGMMLSGGCGNQMAKWILHGRPDLDMFSYDIRRLYPPLSSNKKWVNEKAHESYTKRYSVHYTHDEPLAGRGQRLSQLHEIQMAQGCVFQDRLGWERPGWYNTGVTPVQPYDWYGAYNSLPNSDQRYYNALKAEYTYEFPQHHDLLGNECLTCRSAAAIFDLSHYGKFYLTGPDAQKAANWLFSANVERDPGNTVYSCMLNQRGGIEADLTVSICDSSKKNVCGPKYEGRGFYLVTGCPAAVQNLSHILNEIRKRKYNVQVADFTEDIAILSIQGPKSREILQRLCNADFSNACFPFSTHKMITLAGHEVDALRLTFVGEMGWEIHMPRTSAIPVYEALMASGKSFGLSNAGYRALESLACEKGYRHWHADIRPEDTPLESGLGFTCKLDKKIQFLGSKAIEEQRLRGITKRLVTLTLDDPTRPLWGYEGIWRNGEPVGFIRRCEYAFTLGRAIGYGYVQRPDSLQVTKDFLQSGNWAIESRGKMLSATLHLKHPFDPKNQRIQGIY